MAEVAIKELDLEIDNLSNTIFVLRESLKNDFDEYILKKDSFAESGNTIAALLGSGSSQSDVELSITSNIQKYICNFNSDLKIVCEQLETNAEHYKFLQKILYLHESLELANTCADQDLHKAAEYLKQAEVCINECLKAGRSLEFYKIKNEEYCKLLAHVTLSSVDVWDNLVNFEVSELDNRTKVTWFRISKNYASLLSIYQTLELLRISFKEIFCDRLLKDIFKPLTTNACKVSVETTDDYCIFKIEYSNKVCQVDIIDISDGLVKLFEFINCNLDLQYDNTGFISSIGALRSNDFLKPLFEEHLTKKIPFKRSLLHEYEEAVNEVRKLISVMSCKCFLAENDGLVKEFCSDSASVFDRKVSSRFKEAAIYLMKQDLQNMIKVESISLDFSIPELRQAIQSYDDAERDYWSTIFTLLNNDSRRRCFPECQVSKSINEMINLVRNCLLEASLNDSNMKITLHNTAHEIIYEYLKSPDIHRKLLDMIPQQSALVFTNSLFLIIKLVQFDKEFKTDDLFGELIGQLQNMAFRELNKQIRTQEEIMISSLRKSGLEELSELEVFPKTIEKIVRQCLRQTMLIQNVWMNVLPQDIYCIVVGRLVNRFIEEIIELIISASDIREDIANNLVELFPLINQKAPQVFPESREVHRYVKSWLKLRELGLVLAGSLADINERWAGGSGPLAHEMTPSQVKSLIIALFQSSEIRQRTLAAIK